MTTANPVRVVLPMLNGVTRRAALKAMCLSGLAFLGGCAPEGVTQPRAGGPTLIPVGRDKQPTDVASGVPKRGGAINWGQVNPISTFYPDSTGGGLVSPLLALYDRFVELAGSTLQPTPNLIENWQVSPDNLTWTLKVRPGVRFHGGREMDADDAVFAINYGLDPKSQSRGGALLAAAGASVKTLDKYSFTLALPRPLPGLLYALNVMHAVDRTNPDLATNPVGTGPFRIDSYTPGDRLVLKRFEQYWRSGEDGQSLPYLGDVTIRIIPDPATLEVNLESGAVLGTINISEDAVSRLKGKNGIQVGTLPTLNTQWDFFFNTSKPPLDDARVRLALSHAIDRQRIIDEVLGGVPQLNSQPWPVTSPAFFADLGQIDFDLQKARQLLDAAGHANGFDAQLIFGSTAVAAQFRQMGLIYQADLAKIDVRLKLLELPPPAWLQLFQAEKPTWDLTAHTYGPAGTDPAQLFALYPWIPDPQVNYTHYDSARYRQLAAQSSSETDPAKRLALFREITVLHQQDQWIAPIAGMVSHYANRTALQGVTYPSGQYYPSFAAAWLAI